VLILLAPAIIGLFWGAPLIARELETGTSDLAWNQSITRTRWLVVKLALIGLAAMAVTEGLSLVAVAAGGRAPGSAGEDLAACCAAGLRAGRAGGLGPGRFWVFCGDLGLRGR
jgi:hypothetical protein